MKYLYLVNKDILKLVLEPWLLILLGMCVFSVHDFDFLIRKKKLFQKDIDTSSLQASTT